MREAATELWIIRLDSRCRFGLVPLNKSSLDVMGFVFQGLEGWDATRIVAGMMGDVRLWLYGGGDVLGRLGCQMFFFCKRIMRMLDDSSVEV
jgi:hypothetical protein